MLEQIFGFNTLLADLYQKGPIDLVPTCRALEADIVCKFCMTACDMGIRWLVENLARFAFGNAIGAIDSLATGKELSAVKENDLKSSKMPLVSTPTHVTRSLTANLNLTLQYTKFPFATQTYDSIVNYIFDLTGWDVSSVASTRWFDAVRRLHDSGSNHVLRSTDEICSGRMSS
jgi:hypothetical protein